MFISWSTPHAQTVAESLRDWLKDMIHALDPFVSSLDIAKGERGLAVIARELEGTSHGIICVNRANQNAPWLNFEAGSISKQVDKSRVFPVLIDLPGSDLQGPLREFQYTELFAKKDMLRLAESIWETCPESNISLNQLQRNFHRLWPELMEALEEVKETPSVAEPALPHEGRSAEDKLDELIGLARQNQRRIDSLEAARLFPPSTSNPGERVFTASWEEPRPPWEGPRSRAAHDAAMKEISERILEELGRPVELRILRPGSAVAVMPRGARYNLDTIHGISAFARTRGISLKFGRSEGEGDSEES
ncbi:toll/interleukin-1 receptor domain-containing protein [Streptomyces sp. NBC_00160]|uniref:TIR domain-containing protein n=1 Tax=Streptomyces sp. NBC_00160 TaxID=2903628 RepID=UPI0022594838|nr:TIR domain-containing protein [Streptomyces sp. NBC_00160]MCX5303717.1 toll/interleukin-1 receptor domain-containing protein [Streptomyces sp. NBC_00160]